MTAYEQRQRKRHLSWNQHAILEADTRKKQKKKAENGEKIWGIEGNFHSAYIIASPWRPPMKKKLFSLLSGLQFLFDFPTQRRLLFGVLMLSIGRSRHKKRLDREKKKEKKANLIWTHSRRLDSGERMRWIRNSYQSFFPPCESLEEKNVFFIFPFFSFFQQMW